MENILGICCDHHHHCCWELIENSQFCHAHIFTLKGQSKSLLSRFSFIPIFHKLLSYFAVGSCGYITKAFLSYSFRVVKQNLEDFIW